MTVFDRIKKLAEKQKKTISQVESDLGMSKNYLYKWQKMQPKADSLVKVADYFHVSTDYLLGIDDKEKEGIDGMTNNQKLIAYSIDPDVSNEERDAIIEMVKQAMKFRKRL